MSIRVALYHRTQYCYDRSVELGPHIVRLRPAPHCRTPIRSYSLRISPGEHFLNWQQDPYGNYLARLVFNKDATELKIEVDVQAEMTVINPFDFFLEPEAEHYPFSYCADAAQGLDAVFARHAGDGRLAVHGVSADGRPAAAEDDRLPGRLEPEGEGRDRLRDSAGAGRADLRRDAGEADVVRAATRRWLLVNLLRHLGLAARFVSGLFDSADGRREVARWALGAGERFHRFARVG